MRARPKIGAPAFTPHAAPRTPLPPGGYKEVSPAAGISRAPARQSVCRQLAASRRGTGGVQAATTVLAASPNRCERCPAEERRRVDCGAAKGPKALLGWHRPDSGPRAACNGSAATAAAARRGRRCGARERSEARAAGLVRLLPVPARERGACTAAVTVSRPPLQRAPAALLAVAHTTSLDVLAATRWAKPHASVTPRCSRRGYARPSGCRRASSGPGLPPDRRSPLDLGTQVQADFMRQLRGTFSEPPLCKGSDCCESDDYRTPYRVQVRRAAATPLPCSPPASQQWLAAPAAAADDPRPILALRCSPPAAREPGADVRARRKGDCVPPAADHALGLRDGRQPQPLLLGWHRQHGAGRGAHAHGGRAHLLLAAVAACLPACL